MQFVPAVTLLNSDGFVVDDENTVTVLLLFSQRTSTPFKVDTVVLYSAETLPEQTMQTVLALRCRLAAATFSFKFGFLFIILPFKSALH